MSLPVWWSWVHAPLRTIGQKYPTPKIAWRKHAKSSITQPWIIWFCSYFVHSLDTWQLNLKCHKSLSLRDQRSRSCKIINNSAADCSISLKFRADFDQVMIDEPQTFKVNWSQVKVTAWQHISIKIAIIQAWISCRRLNLVKIISEPSRMCHMALKVIVGVIRIAMKLLTPAWQA